MVGLLLGPLVAELVRQTMACFSELNNVRQFHIIHTSHVWIADGPCWTDADFRSGG
jgi:hypothetical protein